LLGSRDYCLHFLLVVDITGEGIGKSVTGNFRIVDGTLGAVHETFSREMENTRRILVGDLKGKGDLGDNSEKALRVQKILRS
jgi:hypothetical protein